MERHATSIPGKPGTPGLCQSSDYTVKQFFVFNKEGEKKARQIRVVHEELLQHYMRLHPIPTMFSVFFEKKRTQAELSSRHLRGASGVRKKKRAGGIKR